MLVGVFDLAGSEKRTALRRGPQAHQEILMAPVLGPALVPIGRRQRIPSL